MKKIASIMLGITLILSVFAVASMGDAEAGPTKRKRLTDNTTADAIMIDPVGRLNLIFQGFIGPNTPIPLVSSGF